MTREIKFRAWDKQIKKMVDYGFSVDFEDGTLYDDNQSAMSDCILMQFTGLHDKNGKEIYEGDILKYSLRVGKVVWENEVYCGFVIEILTQEGRAYPMKGKIERILGEVKIIGNIYSNPELLTKTI